MFKPVSSSSSHSRRRSLSLPRSLSLLLLLLAPLQVSQAQGAGGGGGAVDLTGTGGRHAILGRIYFPSGVRADLRLKVRLESTRYSELSVLADTNGSFGFRSLLPGSYTVVVEGGEDYETVREGVYIDGEPTRPRSGLQIPSVSRAYQVQVHLQTKRLSQARAKPGVLNAALANIPVSARKAYEKGMEFSQSGDSKKAIEQLKLAISYHPAFSLALNELGVQYLKIAQVEAALQALSSAVKLAPEAFNPRLNYGIALLQKKNFAQAKAELQDALKINPNSPTGHLYLGIALIHEQQYKDAEQEFLQALTLGKQTVSLAHYYLGGLYWRRGEYKLAADELEKYLQAAPTAQDADKIKSTIKELRSKA
jgi:tetratricopeptide (TPR) repeat protein